MAEIIFTRSKLQMLKREYDKARSEGREMFEFQGSELLVSYAKYLIQYLEQKLES